MPESPKPDDWFTRSLAQRLETVFGMGVDRAYDYLAWPPDKCDPHQLAAQKEAVRCMLMMGAKFALDRANEAGRIETMRAVAAELGKRPALPEEGQGDIAPDSHACAHPASAPQVETEPAVPHKDG